MKKSPPKPSTASHTPGPWRVEWPTQPDAMSEVFAPSPPGDAYPWRVAYVMRDSNKHQQPIDDANARLIAAAPELLEALKEVYTLTGENHPARAPAVWERARLTIAKAEGR
jgi:hypothetical protein